MSEGNYTVELSLLRVIITGLPSAGKSQILSHLIPTDICTDCIIKDDGLSVKEALLTSDGHRWEWMQVSKTEASALGVGVGISQAYAKEGHTPNFIINTDEVTDKDVDIWESVKRLGTRYADIKGLTLVNIWDVGVSRVLHDLLPLLLPPSKHLVMLSVVNLATDGDSLHSPVDMHQEKYQKRGEQDILMEPYSKLDYLMEPPSLARCEVIVVGTHADLLPQGKLRARQQSVMRWVGAKAEEMGLGDMLYPKCIAVNTLNQGDVMKIREVIIESIGKRHEECKMEVPLTWLCLRDNLNSSIKWYMTKEELLAAADEYGIMDEREVELFLDIYYKCGSILYNPTDPSSILHDHVIIKPCNFLDRVKKLYHRHQSSEQLLGYLTITSAKKSQKMDGEEFIVKVLEDVDLAVRVDSNLQSEGLRTYFVPSLNPKSTSPSLYKGSTSLYAVFSCSVLQHHHLVTFVKVIHELYSAYVVTDTRSNYGNQLHLQLVHDRTSADITIVANYLELKVTGLSDPSASFDWCSMFKSAAVDFAQRVCLHVPDLQYSLSIVCPHGPHFIPFHALEMVDEDCRKLFCPHCKKDVGLEDSTMAWLRAPYKVSEGGHGVLYLKYYQCILALTFVCHSC